MKVPKGGMAAVIMARRLQTAYSDILNSETEKKTPTPAIIAATSLLAVELVKIVASTLVVTNGPDDTRKAWIMLKREMVEGIEKSISEHEAKKQEG